MAVADGKQPLRFLLTFPGAGREGTIWREKVRSLKEIYTNKLPGLDGLWVLAGWRGGEPGVGWVMFPD